LTESCEELTTEFIYLDEPVVTPPEKFTSVVVKSPIDMTTKNKRTTTTISTTPISNSETFQGEETEEVEEDKKENEEEDDMNMIYISNLFFRIMDFFF